MAEIEQQLREVIDRAAAPVTATEVRVRVAAPPAVTREEPPLRRHWRMLAAAAVLVAVVGIGVVLSANDPHNRVDVVTSVPSTTTPSDTTANTPTMIDIVGLDYRDAEQRVAPLGARVRLSLDFDSKAPNGSVTRTALSPGEPVAHDSNLVIYVALDRATFVSDGPAVGSNNAFPPVGLVVGFKSNVYDERCDVGGRSPGTAVRFLHDELVGCMTGVGVQLFVWLDQLDDVNRPIGSMPDLTGLGYDEAIAKFREVHDGPEFVAVRFSPTSTGTAENPKVIRTVPAAGDSITRTMEISLIVDGLLPIEPGGR